MQFSQIIGQTELKHKLINQAKEQRIPHAQLFLGPEGSGNLALAIAFAQYVNCHNPLDEDSCGKCASCIKYQKLIHPDLHFSFPTIGSKEVSSAFMENWRKAMDENPYLSAFDWLQYLGAENKQGNITREECHEIIKKLNLKSYEGKYKVLILWMPEYLGKNGNALLKLIEEPPAQTLFLFVGNSTDLILATILSRLQLIKINALSFDEIQENLEKTGINPDHARGISHLAEGNWNKALSLLNEERPAFFEQFSEWMRLVYMKNMPASMDLTDSLAGMGREQIKMFLNYCLKMFRECLLQRNGAQELNRINEEENIFIQKFSGFFSENGIEKGNLLLSEAIYHIERNANPKITLFSLSLQLRQLFKRN